MAQYRSITSAASLAVSGDVIRVVGMVDASGNPVAYANQAYFTNQPPESFPITIKAGVTIETTGSAPVYVWPVGGANPTALFEVGSGGASDLTIFDGLNLLGAQAGIRMDGSGANKNVLVRSVTFGRNVVGLSAIGTGSSEFDVDVVNRTLVDSAVQAANPPTLQASSIGMRFHAVESAQGRPRVFASVATC